MFIIGGRTLDFNDVRLQRPFETASIAGGYSFSHGHLIENAPYSSEYVNIFNWEEPYQTYLAWKAGYSMYAPNERVIWHQWDRTYRPAFGKDVK